MVNVSLGHFPLEKPVGRDSAKRFYGFDLCKCLCRTSYRPTIRADKMTTSVYLNGA